MGVIKANSIGIPLLEFFCQDETTARVVARYAATLLLQSADILWAITTHDNAGAYRVVTATLPTWSVNAIVRVREGVASLDDEALQWDERAWWNPSPRRRALRDAERALAAQRIASMLSEWTWHEAQGVWDEAVEWWTSLCTALQHCDEDGLRACVVRLLGRGAGLTPAGDDVWQALLVTLRTGDAQDQHTFDIVKRVSEPALLRTTPLSRQFLREALQGWACAPLKTVLDDLPNVNEKHMRPLLQVGASSGLAYGLGVWLGLAYVNTTSPYPRWRIASI